MLADDDDDDDDDSDELVFEWVDCKIRSGEVNKIVLTL